MVVVAAAAAAGQGPTPGALVRGSKTAGDPIPGRFIVTFAPNASTADAIAGVQRRVFTVAATAARKAKRAAATSGRMSAASVAATEFGKFEVEHVLGSQVAASEVGGMGARSAGRLAGRPPLGAVLVVSEQLDSKQVKRAMTAAAGVSSVIEDRVISVALSNAAAAPSCAAPSFLAGTVANPVGINWPGCWIPGVTKVAWFGERCGTYMTATSWIGMYAFYAANSTLVAGCVQYRARTPGGSFNAANFGACGVAPAVAQQLPTQLCAESLVGRRGSSGGSGQQSCIPADQLWGYTGQLDSPVKCGGVSTSSALYRGIRCGPGQRWVRWSSVTLPDGGRACRFSRNAADLRWNAQWLGQCGVPPQYSMGLPTRVCGTAEAPSGPLPRLSPRPSPPPAQPAPAPAPAPPPVAPPAPSAPSSGFSLPKVLLANNEIVHVNMKRIAAVVNNMLPDMTSAGVSIAIVDTGVDKRHPDLNVVGGKSFCSSEVKGDPYSDGFGHGTHVAGIVGAKNNGQGIVGAAPGVPIYSLKVLDSEGTGTTSDLLRAYEWLYYNARALGIRVVNLSLTGGGGEADPQCEWAAALAKQGLTLVAAAGNNKVNLMQEAPGACAKTLVVTSYTDKDGVSANDAASWFSNYLPVGQLTDARRRRVVSAPGEDIISTYPIDRQGNKGLPQGYQSMSGTSMACPHVSGVAVRCYAAGECDSDVDTEAEKLTAFSKAYNTAYPTYGFTGDAVSSPTSSQYLGYSVYAARW